MVKDREIKLLFRKVIELEKGVRELTECVIETNEYLGKLREWLAELCDVLDRAGESDDEYEKERQEFDEHLNPVNRRHRRNDGF